MRINEAQLRLVNWQIERILATRDNSNLRFWLKMNPDGIIWNELDNIKDAYLYE